MAAIIEGDGINRSLLPFMLRGSAAWGKLWEDTACGDPATVFANMLLLDLSRTLCILVYVYW